MGEVLTTVITYAQVKGTARVYLSTKREWPNEHRAGNVRTCLESHVGHDPATFAALGLKYEDWQQLALESYAL